MTADLRSSQVTCHVDIDAPKEGRAKTRVSWLLRQLKDAPGAARVEAFVMHGRGSSAAELLSSIREDPTLVTLDPRDLKSFRIATTRPLGAKRGTGRGSFIDSVQQQVDSFYADVLVHLRAWSASPPALRPTHPQPPAIELTSPPSLAANDFSSQDGPSAPPPARPDDCSTVDVSSPSTETNDLRAAEPV